MSAPVFHYKPAIVVGSLLVLPCLVGLVGFTALTGPLGGLRSDCLTRGLTPVTGFSGTRVLGTPDDVTEDWEHVDTWGN